MRSSALARNATHNRMHKRRVKIAMKVLDQVKTQLPEAKQFIDDCVEQECSKENISVDEVIFHFTYQEAKS